MNDDHRLDARDSQDLAAVEQLEDRSDLSTLYPQRATQWDGVIMTAEQREAARDKATEEISTSLRRHFVTIGFLVTLPLLLAAAIVASAMEINLLNSEEAESRAILTAATIIVGGAWLATSFIALRKVVHLFYDHAMRAAPFIVIVLAMISISVQSLYILTFTYHQSTPLMTVGIVGAASVLWSIILSFALLWIWTSPRLADSLKIAYIAIMTLSVVGAAGVIGAASLFVH